MSNVERLRAVYSEWARGNFRAGGELLAPDVVFEPMADGRVTLRGPAAVADYMREFFAQWREFRVEEAEFLELGEAILVTERQRATGAASGVRTELTAYAVWVFRGDRVVRVRWDTDRRRALEAVGLAD